METLAMSRRERSRLEVLGRVVRGELTLVKASELMGVSYRQGKRVYARYRAEGDRGLVHRLRGRRSNCRIDEARKERMLSLYREKYGDFGPTLAAEYLEQEDALPVAVETLRGWLKAEGLWQRKRRRGKHRKWRERKAQRGELVQMDGSHHDWFEGRRGWAVLMVLVDDATNETYARFFEGETTEAAFAVFGRYVERAGLPRGLYVDKDSIYRTTREATVDENLAEQAPLTQFGRAMQELGVELILAHSPQAKGRVERRNGVLQDRLVKALRVAGIRDLERANAFLEERFLPEFNAKFALAARERGDLHRRVPRDVRLERVLAFREERVVQQDWTLRWRNRWLQLTEANRKLSLAGRKVQVVERLDGTLEVLLGRRALAFQELTQRPERVSPAARRRRPRGAGKPRWKPAAEHPWRRGLKERCVRKAQHAGEGGDRAPGGGLCSAPSG